MKDWPDPLEQVVPQETITVTAAADPAECALALHAPNSIRYSWPNSTVSEFGTLVHETLANLAGNDDGIIEDLIESKTAANDLLRSQCRKKGIDPSFLENHWFTGKQMFLRALQEMRKLPLQEYEGDSQLSNTTTMQTSDPEASHVSKRTTEGSMKDLELGVRGKFDLRVVLPDHIQIDDFKSGMVCGDEKKLEKWKKQVAIYALISSRATNHQEHRARIIAADGIFEVELTPNYLNTLSRELIDNKKRWPTNTFSAFNYSLVSGACRNCQVRHVCTKYLSTSPWLRIAEWDGEDEKIWSWDVWGRIARIGTSGKSIVVRTPDHKRAIINHANEFLQSDELAIDDEIGIFGLWQARSYTDSKPVFRPPKKSPYSVPPRCMIRKNRSHR